jgi:hypothetical protein
MRAFFPVGSTTLTATTTTSAATPLPTGGPFIRIARETAAVRVFIAFGTASVVATTANMELVSGIVEELQNPNSTAYTHFAVITNTSTCGVNLSTGPRYE